MKRVTIHGEVLSFPDAICSGEMFRALCHLEQERLGSDDIIVPIWDTPEVTDAREREKMFREVDAIEDELCKNYVLYKKERFYLFEDVVMDTERGVLLVTPSAVFTRYVKLCDGVDLHLLGQCVMEVESK